MELLLCKDIPKLGHVGDIVTVAAGYGRNYLVPTGLAVEPTAANLRAIEDQKRHAAEERARQAAELKDEARRLQNTEVTIDAAANEEGHLYGSVTTRDIAEALLNEGHAVKPEQVMLEKPIRQLDTVTVTVVFGEDISAEVKVWVVRDKSTRTSEDEPGATEEQPTDQ